MEYIVIVEEASDGSYTAYLPDLPGCVACGDSIDEVRALIKDAVQLHLESLRAHNEPVPPPKSQVFAVKAA
jgi:predicted RNase H-like HicB family nuclease